jgi:hypothetical protein
MIVGDATLYARNLERISSKLIYSQQRGDDTYPEKLAAAVAKFATQTCLFIEPSTTASVFRDGLGCALACSKSWLTALSAICVY